MINALTMPKRSSYEKYGDILSDEQLLRATVDQAGVECTTTHRPVNIDCLVDNVRHGLDRHGFRYGPAMNIAQKRMKGVDAYTDFEIRMIIEHDDIDPVVGTKELPVERLINISCSYSKSAAARISFGINMMICGNGLMIYQSELVSKHRQTPSLDKDQFGLCYGAIANAKEQYGFQDKRIEHFENLQFDNNRMKIAAYDLADAGVINPASIVKVVREWEIAPTDEATEAQAAWSDRNLWSAINCVTAINQGSAGNRASCFGQQKRDRNTVSVLEKTALMEIN